MYDAVSESYIFVVVLCILGDNVCASELLNHLGSKVKKLCRFYVVNIVRSIFRSHQAFVMFCA